MEKRLYFNLHENMSSIKTEPLKETFYLAHSRTTTESQEPLASVKIIRIQLKITLH